ncbi:pyridoxamine 5'-phosphate oxidase family protein [Croceitalea marina]|uniref:Pyridoxamine 5'-phosphate oxidase family protein n=1 Tax=Croceitalea marina TaxID=1775166 RepID=A0ABW5MWB2_9FLAO
MNLTKEIKAAIDKSVLCWLATVSKDNIPNVSPKEIFNHYGKDKIIVANIASPQTVKNIKQNANVCISFIDILLQKGFQIKGEAEIIDKTHLEFLEMEKVLAKMAKGKFPFATITKIKVLQAKKIIAPKYILYPETTEEEQIKSAKKLYGI